MFDDGFPLRVALPPPLAQGNRDFHDLYVLYLILTTTQVTDSCPITHQALSNLSGSD